MNRTKVSDNFYLDEFINPTTYRNLGTFSKSLLRPGVIECAQFLRKKTGLPITINNWAVGGSYEQSGLRDFSSGVGAKYSAHKYGAAIDLKIGSLSSFEMADVLCSNEEEILKIGIKRYESPEKTQGNRDWLHVDCFVTGSDKLYMFEP